MFSYKYVYTYPDGVEQVGVFAFDSLTHAVAIPYGGGWTVWSAWPDEASAERSLRTNGTARERDDAQVIPIVRAES